MGEMLTEEEGKMGLKLAREAIERYIKDNIRINADEFPLTENFERKRGVFVTINKYGDLRGCIGYPYPVKPLKKAIVDAAISAAVEDPRFPPLSRDELADIEIELTVLTNPEKLEVKKRTDLLKKIEIGRHGLIVKRGLRQGLLLPQVATEYNFTVEEFLAQTCMKAGLYPDAWLADGTEISVFEGQIFREKE